MDAWWTQASGRAKQVTKLRAVAYYRHSAEIGQENSVEIQQDNVRAFAGRHDIEVVKEFADRGKSGLNAEGRPAFNKMMEWVRTRDDFCLILVLDVSRWGRFQDTDLSAHYESLCTQHGKQVVYTNIGFTRDEDRLINQLRKSIDRYQSAEYSRTLSKKVFEGAAKVAHQGYRPGGAPPYGFHRLMLDEHKKPDRILQPGQRKAIQNGRVVLVPGDTAQVEVLQEIFVLFVERGFNERQIAGHLNAKNKRSSMALDAVAGSGAIFLASRVPQLPPPGKERCLRNSTPACSTPQSTFRWPAAAAMIFRHRSPESFGLRMREIVPSASTRAPLQYR